MSSFKEKSSALVARLPHGALAILGAVLLWAAWPVRGPDTCSEVGLATLPPV